MEEKVIVCKLYGELFMKSDSIADSDASAASNGGKYELMYYVHEVSSHLPPLDAADASESAIESARNFIAQ